MLKWTVVGRRDHPGDGDPKLQRPLSVECPMLTPSLSTPHVQKSASSAKRRRSSTALRRRRSSGVGTYARSDRGGRNSLDGLMDAEKENRFTSTPIKTGTASEIGALRDVGNLTPNVKDKQWESFLANHRALSARKPKSEKKSRTPVTSPRHQHKKKKDCLSNHNDLFLVDSQTSNYFRPFDTVDSHIEAVSSEDLCSCKKSSFRKIKKIVTDSYAPTLPTFANEYSPCSMMTTHCLETLNRNSAKKLPSAANILEDLSLPPNKKQKIDHVNDFLHQISFLTSPETAGCLPGLSNPSRPYDKVTPLVKKFLDFRFSKTKTVNSHNNSSYINNMSLDKIVDALLDTSDDSIRPTVKKDLNSSMVVNIESENENNNNEENVIEIQRLRAETASEHSSDSGFRSSNTENSHQLDNNFVCKCNNNEKTVIQINETYNERCVDDFSRIRKRQTSPYSELESKKLLLDKSQEGLFSLRRQKGIRRRKPFSIDKSNLFRTNSDCSSSKFDCDDTPTAHCYLENKNIMNETFDVKTPIEAYRGIRKCLNFDSSSKADDSSIYSEGGSTCKNTDIRGSMDVKLFPKNGNLLVNVISCKDLYRCNGEKINAYVKVALSDRLGDSRRKRNGRLQRTPVHSDSSRPHFNHTFKFPMVEEEANKRLHLEVWHRDRTTRTSEFLGCMSFDVGDVIEGDISGSFRLLPQSTGRTTNVPITHDLLTSSPTESSRREAKMCESQSSVEELICLEDLDGELRRSTSKTVLTEQQKYADENLFLRYLELDPTDGPDANSAATQRKATGNRNGRTPFTCTKRLTRPPKSGFGFSVVWTHPPRIERVEKGLPADRAGILPGDYIIFVDKHNVVMMPEIDILNLIRSYGSQLTLEIFRRNPSRNGSVPSVKRLSTPLASSLTMGSTSVLPITSCSNLVQRRPSTVCSTNTASGEYNRRKLHLPQVTFSAEKPTNNPDENRRKAMFQLISKEQQYATSLQFAITRFVSALAERKDLITPSEHRILFQNCEEILRITEDILDHLVQDDGEPQIHLLAKTYFSKLQELTMAYKRYCSGIKKADCILANKTKNCNSDFCRFLQVPQVPRRRPDITTFIHKPLEHYREILKLLITIQSCTKPNHDDLPVINQVVHDLQLTYREITSESGLMEPLGEGRPLLTVQDLENRLVFTKCKPFVLNKPGRQWIFGGDLARVEGRNVRQYWTLLFSDLLLFAKASRDRVLFVIEDPLPLSHITDMFFNVRKKDTEFRININPEGRKASSPTVHCGPDLSRTPKKNATKKTVILRAPTPELKAVWQNLLQRQIFQLNSGMDGSSVSSPLESPEVPITSSVATLQSAESLSIRRQTSQNINQNCQNCQNENDNREREIQRQIDALIELKCKQLGKGFNSKYNALHLEQWMKGQLNREQTAETPEEEKECLLEEWTAEMLRKRSEELQLIDSEGNIKSKDTKEVPRKSENGCDEGVLSENDHSPSKSTTTESQITVRSSPLVPETVPVCRQCHKTCLSSNGTMNGSTKHLNGCNINRNIASRLNNNPVKDKNDNDEDDWQAFMLVGLMPNPAASLVHIDPFSVPPVPKISVVPATPESSISKTTSSDTKNEDSSCLCQNDNLNGLENHRIPNENEKSPDDSPESEEHPYHSLSSSVATLRRFGTVSSLERVASEEKDEIYENNIDDNTEEEEEEEEVEENGIDNEAFNHSAIRHWTLRAGSFVAEKMAFLERLGEDYRTVGFFDRYLKTTEIIHVNGEEIQEEETSGGTSGEEIWGTPTSGGELDDNLNSPGYDEKQSPNDGSMSSEYGDETELMMDELLMTPPISGAIMRGLLPRRTLEPLIEEECSETSSTSSIESKSEPSVSPTEQGNGTGDAADTCSAVAEKEDETKEAAAAAAVSTQTSAGSTPTTEAPTATVKIHRSESYRHIIEAAENEGNEERNVYFFSRFRPAAKFVNIERVPRSKSIRIFEFFNMRKPERRIYETYPEGGQLFKVFDSEEPQLEDSQSLSSPKQLSPRRLKDKQLDRRFWKQLSRRRGSSKGNVPA
ncbi:uncharacterized protein LOC114332848 [Diabrotica virgifera virgifera]|uniref:Uncharacterized protein n=1 Tax=Diabrotica virgifera virgifera TaxID=50390 RepID=A0ABM5K8B7_DIAVI|nr:uncharacterized protein LOC114332848 [Diabrotica virgifera virgifera]